MDTDLTELVEAAEEQDQNTVNNVSTPGKSMKPTTDDPQPKVDTSKVEIVDEKTEKSEPKVEQLLDFDSESQSSSQNTEKVDKSAEETEQKLEKVPKNDDKTEQKITSEEKSKPQQSDALIDGVVTILDLPEKPKSKNGSAKNGTAKPNGSAAEKDERDCQAPINLKDGKKQLVNRGDLDDRELQMTQPTSRIMIYAVTSLILCGLILCTAVASLMLVHTSPSRQSVQIENKWLNIILLFSGLSAMNALRQKTQTSLITCLLFALISCAAGGITCVVHAINMYFRYQDTLTPDGNTQMDRYALWFVNINLLLTILGALSCGVSMLLFRAVFHVAGKNFGYALSVDKHRLKLSLFGLTQIICGMMITAWWTAIEVFSQGRNAGLQGMPTSELLTHGAIFVCTGYMQMMATSKGNQPSLVSAAILNCASLLLTLYFFTRPFATMYFIIQQSQDFFSIMLMDGRVWVTSMLIILYTVQLTVVLYSTIKLIHLAAGERVMRIDNIMAKWHTYFNIACWCQLGIGIIYAFFELIAFGAFFLYKLDFNPLPLFIIISAVFARGSIRMGSLMMLSVTAALTVCCAAFCLRDMYLFTYHMLSHDQSPDTENLAGSGAKVTGARLFVHFGLAFTAVVELVSALSILYLIGRILSGTVKCICDKIHLQRTLSFLNLFIYIQYIAIGLIWIAGLILFLQPQFFLEKYGDVCLTLGALCFFANLFVHQSTKTQSVMMLPAFGMQLAALLFVWGSLDSFAYLIHDFLVDRVSHIVKLKMMGHEEGPDTELDVDMTGLAVASVAFMAWLIVVLIGSAILTAFANILQHCRLQKHDAQDQERSGELLVIGSD